MSMVWINLAQNMDRWWAVVKAVMNLWVPYNVENFLTSCEPISFTGMTQLHGVSE